MLQHITNIDLYNHEIYLITPTYSAPPSQKTHCLYKEEEEEEEEEEEDDDEEETYPLI